MAAHEEKNQRIVFFWCSLDSRPLCCSDRLQGQLTFATAASHLSAHMVGHPPGGDVNEPAARIVGHAFPRPLNDRCHQCLLNGILGGGEVMETADDRAEYLRHEFAQQMLGTGV